MSNLSHRILLVVTEEIEIEFDDRWCVLLLRKKHDDDGFFYALLSLSLSVLNYACVCALFSLSLSLFLSGART